MPTTSSYTARDLLIEVAADQSVWTKLDERAKLVAAIQPLVETAQIVGDEGMHGELRQFAALHQVEGEVEWQPSMRTRPLQRALPMQRLVRLLRDAGLSRDPEPLMELAMSTAELRGLGRCARLLASAALALGALRPCRVFVLAARTVGGAAAPA